MRLVRFTHVQRLLSFLAVVIATGAFAQDTTHISWDSPQALTMDTNYLHVVPHIQTEGENVYVIWVAANTGLSFFIRSTDNGETWGDRFMLNDTTLRVAAVNNYSVGAGKINYLSDWPDYGPPLRYWLWQRRSCTAGATWEQGHTLWDAEAGMMSGDDGNRVLVYRLFPQTTVYPLFAASFDTGVTWMQFPQSLPSGRGPGGMVLRPPRLYLTREIGVFGTPEVAFTLSTDFGATWTNEVLISSTDTIVSDLPHLTGDATGNVSIVWRDFKYGTPNGIGGSILLKRSTDFGSSWLSEQRLTDVPDGLIPRVASWGRILGVVWIYSGGPSGFDTNFVVCSFSSNSGETISRGMNISPNTTHAGDPDVSVSNSVIHAVWWQQARGTERYSTLYYRRGRVITTAIVGQGEPGCPREPQLYVGYPNPFNGLTTIGFELPSRKRTRIVVFDLLGQIVAVLCDEERNAGFQAVRWNGIDIYGCSVASGVYFVRLDTDKVTLVRKLLLLR